MTTLTTMWMMLADHNPANLNLLPGWTPILVIDKEPSNCWTACTIATVDSLAHRPIPHNGELRTVYIVETGSGNEANLLHWLPADHPIIHVSLDRYQIEDDEPFIVGSCLAETPHTFLWEIYLEVHRECKVFCAACDEEIHPHDPQWREPDPNDPDRINWSGRAWCNDCLPPLTDAIWVHAS